MDTLQKTLLTKTQGLGNTLLTKTQGLGNTSTRIYNRISKLFKNQQINFFIIMFLILLITCYSLLSNTLKYTVSMLLSNPAVIVICIIIIHYTYLYYIYFKLFFYFYKKLKNNLKFN